MQKSQRPHIVAEHQWYKKENDTKKFNSYSIVNINIDIDISRKKRKTFQFNNNP